MAETRCGADNRFVVRHRSVRKPAANRSGASPDASAASAICHADAMMLMPRCWRWRVLPQRY